MLSCKAGSKIINTIDYKHDDIKKWSDKRILRCPVCDGEMIFRKGMIKIPHFAHKDSCTESKGYWENETKEHYSGKILLYKWLKNHPGIKNLKLEDWIPETKQRPDIMFEFLGKIFAIEYQCSPITIEEFNERRERYNLMNIIDIWVLGLSNFNFKGHSKVKFKALDSDLYRINKFVLYLNPFKKTMHKIYLNNVFSSIVDSKIDNLHVDTKKSIVLPGEVDFIFENLLHKNKKVNGNEKQFINFRKKIVREQEELGRLVHHRDEIRKVRNGRGGDDREMVYHIQQLLKNKKVFICNEESFASRYDKWEMESLIPLLNYRSDNDLLQIAYKLSEKLLEEKTIHIFIDKEKTMLDVINLIGLDAEKYRVYDFKKKIYEKVGMGVGK
jgi:competence CoiA-like predicted nuclease